MYIICPHFVDEATETWRNKELVQNLLDEVVIDRGFYQVSLTAKPPHLTTRCATWSVNACRILCSSCLNLLNINTVLCFCIRKDYIVFQHIVCFSLTNKNRSFSSLSRYTVEIFIYFQEFVPQTQREQTSFIYLRRNLGFPGLTSLQIPLKWKF